MKNEKDITRIKATMKKIGLELWEVGLVGTSVELDNNRTLYIKIVPPSEYCDKCGGVKSE